MVLLTFILVFLSYVQANGILEQKISISLASCIAQDWATCSGTIAEAIDVPCFPRVAFPYYKMYEPMVAFGGICNISLYSTISFKWKSELQCSHLSDSLVGFSMEYKSRSSALRGAVQDFIMKAGKDGILKHHHIVSYNLGYIVTDPTSNAELTTLQLSHFLHLSCRSTLFMYVISIERHKKRHYLQQLLQQIKPQHRIQKRVLIQCWLQQHTQIQQSQQSNYSCH